MPPVEISSPDNPLIKEFMRLSKSGRCRRAAGKLAVEGPNLLEQALSAGLLPEFVLYTKAFAGERGRSLPGFLPNSVRRIQVTEAVFAKLTATETPQAVAALIPYQEPDPAALAAGPLRLALLLDRLQDPGNLGTVLRTAAAAGAEAVFYTAGSADPFSPKVLRATAGAVFHIPTARAAEPLKLIQQLKRAGMQAAAADPRSDRFYWNADFRRPTLLIIGNERGGISAELAAAADCTVAIPRSGRQDSLNAAVAAGILLYESVRQRSC